MKTFLNRSSSRAVLLAAAALFCTLSVRLPAEEPLSTTAQRLDETVTREGDATAAATIGAKFTTLAGSEENATALVTGLHNGTAVTLSSTAANGTVTTTEFQPATGKLGYGNAFISLALAEESLAKAGITEPTSAQLVAALNGGEITGGDGTLVTLTGVLALRAEGQGWGNIAKALDVKLGRVVSALHAANQRVANPGRPDFAGKTDRVNGRPVTAGRPEGAGRPAWAGHSSLPNPGHMPRPGKP
jgi:hypothetical protein